MASFVEREKSTQENAQTKFGCNVNMPFARIYVTGITAKDDAITCNFYEHPMGKFNKFSSVIPVGGVDISIVYSVTVSTTLQNESNAHHTATPSSSMKTGLACFLYKKNANLPSLSVTCTLGGHLGCAPTTCTDDELLWSLSVTD